MSKDFNRFRIEKPIPNGFREEELIKTDTGYVLYSSFYAKYDNGEEEASSVEIEFSYEQALAWAKENLDEEQLAHWNE
ncbi:MAG: hypothetical protein ACLRZ9_02355 [Eubacterium sp.]